MNKRIKLFIASFFLLGASNIFAHPCASPEMLANTMLTQAEKVDMGAVGLGQSSFEGETWYVGVGLFEDEDAVYAYGPEVLSRAHEADYDEDMGLCIYYQDMSVFKIVVASKVPLPQAAVSMLAAGMR